MQAVDTTLQPYSGFLTASGKKEKQLLLNGTAIRLLHLPQLLNLGSFHQGE